ncbi:MAG: hypothetical protein GY817_01265 [bacterium]|nr:hypothetical protein [bacterium]
MAELESILEKIKKVTKSKDLNDKTVRFIQWAVKEIGPDRVMAQLSDTEDIIRSNEVKTTPIQVFIGFLSEVLDIQKKSKPKSDKKPIKTYFDQDQESLINRFEQLEIARSVDDVQEDSLMESPYADSHFPVIAGIDASWFTLANNRDKSDKVKIILRTMNGDKIKASMVRGRNRPNSEEKGILTVYHAKLFSALTLAWVQKGSPYRKIKSKDGNLKYVECVLYITARELAHILRWKSFGGADLNRLTDWLDHLHTRPYYLDLKKINGKGYNFKILRDVNLIDYTNKQGRQETLYEVIFHPYISGLLLDRRAATRAQDLIYIDNQLGFLTKFHIEPRLLSRFKQGKNHYDKTLTNLIEAMSLPKASWHKYPSQRKQVFEKAIKHIDNTRITENQILRVSIKKGKTDYLLVAHVERRKKELSYDLKEGKS